MNWNEVKGEWKQWSGEVRKQWGELTDDEIQQAEGHREKLEGLIQQRYGVASEEAKKQVDNWLGGLKS